MDTKLEFEIAACNAIGWGSVEIGVDGDRFGFTSRRRLKVLGKTSL